MRSDLIADRRMKADIAEGSDLSHTAGLMREAADALSAAAEQSDLPPTIAQAIEELAEAGRSMAPAYVIEGKRLRALSAAQQAQVPVDPMDTPLPCDVTVGGGTHRKGTSLRSLVARMTRLHLEAFGPMPTKEEADRNFAELTAPSQPVRPVAGDDARRYQALCATPNWSFIEKLCLQFAAHSAAEFKAGMDKAIDTMVVSPFGVVTHEPVAPEQQAKPAPKPHAHYCGCDACMGVPGALE